MNALSLRERNCPPAEHRTPSRAHDAVSAARPEVRALLLQYILRQERARKQPGSDTAAR